MINLKSKAYAGTKIAGTMIRALRTPATVLFAKNAGLDFVMYDCEHGGFDPMNLHDIFLLGNAAELACFVRVPELSKDYISRFLDIGAQGIMVPMIETREQAEKLVWYSKYQPIGGRGMVTNSAHTGYVSPPHLELMEEANARIMTIAQIETVLAVENIEEIAAVPGIDMLLIGPNDLSVSLGIPGDLENPIELEAIAKVAAAAKKNNKLFCVHAGPNLLRHFVDQLDVIMQKGDTDILAAGFAGIKKSYDELLGNQ